MESQGRLMNDSEVEFDEEDSNDSNLVDNFDSADEDSCTLEEIHNQFSNRYTEVCGVKVTKGDVSCSALLADDHSANIASVLSNKNVVIVDRQTFKILKDYGAHKKEITDLRFSPTNSNLVYTSSLDGTIKMWDLRSGSFEKKIIAKTDEGKKPLTAFDISSHERLICAGTELIGEDSFLLFWDQRSSDMLGGYWKSHSDDISCVRFNPKESETLASAGADGLMNIFDVSQSSEDTALTYCLNAEATVHSICWRNENKKASILTFTDYHSIQLWDVQEAIPAHKFSRECITKALRRKVAYECYSIPLSCSTLSKNPVLVAGSGLEDEEQSCLRTLVLNERTGHLDPHGLLVCKNSDQLSMTQVASLSDNSEEILTVREDGYITLWRKKTSSDNNHFLKHKTKKDKKKIKPY